MFDRVIFWVNIQYFNNIIPSASFRYKRKAISLNFLWGWDCTFKSFFHLILFWFASWCVIFNDWKFSVSQLIFCHETNLVSRTSFFSYIRRWRRCVVCTLSLSHIRGEIPWGRVYHQPYKVFTKQTLHKVWCFLLYYEFHLLVWTDLQIPAGLPPLTKEIFKEKHHI